MALYSFGLLCFTMSLMVAVVSGTSPFYSRPLASVSGAGNRGDSIFNRYYENAAAHSMQAESCPVSGAHEVCHTADLESDFQVHICPTDGKIQAYIVNSH
ncbi:MAG: hypothetical protein MJE68_17315 [Proteobacteria bacterium]|nr:hypothetical protein [Pseudomonadota bacterium]